MVTKGVFGSLFGILVLLVVTSAKFLWIETPPAWDDECTIVQYGHKRFDLQDIHWPAKCRDGGLIWLGTTGRFHAYMYVDLETKQEFELCLTGGLPERMHVFYNYAGHYLESMALPVWYMRPRRHETCKRSINGTMDLLIESPLLWIDYYSYFSFNITLIEDYQPKPQPPDKPWTVGGQMEETKEKKDPIPAFDENDIDYDIIDEDDILADIDIENDDFNYW